MGGGVPGSAAEVSVSPMNAAAARKDQGLGWQAGEMCG